MRLAVISVPFHALKVHLNRLIEPFVGFVHEPAGSRRSQRDLLRSCPGEILPFRFHRDERAVPLKMPGAHITIHVCIEELRACHSAFVIVETQAADGLLHQPPGLLVEVVAGDHLKPGELKLEPAVFDFERVENIVELAFTAVHQRASEPVVGPLINPPGVRRECNHVAIDDRSRPVIGRRRFGDKVVDCSRPDGPGDIDTEVSANTLVGVMELPQALAPVRIGSFFGMILQIRATPFSDLRVKVWGFGLRPDMDQGSIPAISARASQRGQNGSVSLSTPWSSR